jgi:hypothetical protein
MRRYVVSVLLVAALSSTGSGQTEGTPVLSALQAELTRSLEHLKSQPTPPYFLSYFPAQNSPGLSIGASKSAWGF